MLTDLSNKLIYEYQTQRKSSRNKKQKRTNRAKSNGKSRESECRSVVSNSRLISNKKYTRSRENLRVKKIYYSEKKKITFLQPEETLVIEKTCSNARVKMLLRMYHAAAAAKSHQLCPILCDPIDQRLTRLRSLGFSRQAYWTGLPFPSPVHESEKWKWSCSVLSNSSRPHGPQPTRLLRPWDFPGKSTGVGCHCLLQIYSIEKLNMFGVHFQTW